MSNVPNDLKYTSTHEWISCDAEEVTIGITEHAQELLGDLVFVDLPEVGNTICAGDDLGVVESVKAASDFYSPISGTVISVNTKVSDDPSLVNSDPYGEGWLVKIKANSLNEAEELLNAEDYQQKIAEED